MKIGGFKVVSKKIERNAKGWSAYDNYHYEKGDNELIMCLCANCEKLLKCERQKKIVEIIEEALKSIMKKKLLKQVIIEIDGYDLHCPEHILAKEKVI